MNRTNQELRIIRTADMLGTIIAVACIMLALPHIDATNWTLLGYTFGIVVLTNKVNRIVRGE